MFWTMIIVVQLFYFNSVSVSVTNVEYPTQEACELNKINVENSLTDRSDERIHGARRIVTARCIPLFFY